MKNGILILGAGLLQKPSFEAAKTLGLNIFCVDANENALCVPLADEFQKIDLKDKVGIYKYASLLKAQKNLKGIFTAGTDFSTSVSYAAEKLNLPSHSYEAAMNAKLKGRMRKCFSDKGVPSPKYITVTDDDKEALSALEQIGFPCVVKPCDNMGARGCRLIRNEKEALPAIKTAFENSLSRSIILEEYMDGPEFSIDAIVYKGSLTITGFADRHIYYSPYFIETGHTMPTRFPREKQLELIKTFSEGVSALGLTEGEAKADIKYTKNGPQIGEIAARLSGGYMSGWTYPYSSDFPLTQEAVKIAVGMEPDLLLEKRVLLDDKTPLKLYEIPSVRVSAERAWISIPGKIASITAFNDFSYESVKNVFPRGFKAGDFVDFPRNNVSKCGNCISVSDDFESAIKRSEEACSKNIIRLEPFCKKTEDYLNKIEAEDEKDFPPSAFTCFEKIEELFSSSEVGPQASGFKKVPPSHQSILEENNVSSFSEDFIGENESVLKNVPSFIKEYLNLPEKDFNYRTALEEAELFNKIKEKHSAMSLSLFWKALFRGGLQLALYVSDCADKKEKENE